MYCAPDHTGVLGFGDFRGVSRDYLGGCFSRPQAVGRSGQRPCAEAQGQDNTAGLAPAVAPRSAVEMAGFPGLAAVWLAPPCGTSSRAREIPLLWEDEPRPLRSVECPEGLPGLGPSDAERAAKANELYRLTARIWDFCCENGIVVIIENPYRSFFWHCSAIEHTS